MRLALFTQLRDETRANRRDVPFGMRLAPLRDETRTYAWTFGMRLAPLRDETRDGFGMRLARTSG